MHRRTFFGGTIAGFVGVLFPKRTEAVTHELIDHGLSHEELAQKIVVNSEGFVCLDCGPSIGSLITQREKSARTGSTVIVDDNGVKRRFSLSKPGWRTVYFSNNNTFFGCIGERWFQLG